MGTTVAPLPATADTVATEARLMVATAAKPTAAMVATEARLMVATEAKEATVANHMAAITVVVMLGASDNSKVGDERFYLPP